MECSSFEKKCSMKKLLFILFISMSISQAMSQGSLRITEVMSNGSTMDWFELTNISNQSIDIAGYRFDDNSFSFASSVPLNGITTLAPGERVFFIEGNNSMIQSFVSFWGLSNIQVGNYVGSNLGFSTAGDGVIIFDASGLEVTRVSFGAATAGKSFYWGYDVSGQFNVNYVGANNVGLVSSLGTMESQVTSVSVDASANWASPGTSIVTCPQFNSYFQDADNDGYGNVDAVVEDCIAPNGYVANEGDCDDNNPVLNAGAIEICNGSDDNCDGEVDEYVMNTYYIDVDMDGFGNLNEMVLACQLPVGFADNADDCDDAMLLYLDSDFDGFGGLVLDGCGVETSSDCDDSNAAIYPGASEICNEQDDNCDGSVDESVQSLFYSDEDGDGFGNMDAPVFACSVGNGIVENSNDCDDNNASIYPQAVEICNLIDDNCNLEIDEFAEVPFYQDMDGDGFGNANEMIMACFSIQGYVSNDQDCDDNMLTYVDNDGDGFGSDIADACGVSNLDDCDDFDATTYPGASELCDALDNNCNGDVDELFGQNMFYADEDGDGFGDLNNVIFACVQPEGTVTNSDDCDDANFTFEDLDGDGYGSEVQIACGVLLGGDCDDFSNTLNPGTAEVCNDQDDDCDGEVDEFVLIAFYGDADGDGFGSANDAVFSCVVVPGYVLNGDDCDDAIFLYEDLDGDGEGSLTLAACGVDNSLDCDDSNVEINTLAVEVCDDQDQNCNGEVDENVTSLFYADADMDGFGDVNQFVLSCDAPQGYVDNSEDCDDLNLTYSDEDGDGFGSTELSACGVDNNSDCNDFEVTYLDMDGDGFGSMEWEACGVDNDVDCDDANAAINPLAIEMCNDMDENCNLEVDEGVLNAYYADADVDGFGNQNDVVFACSLVSGYVNNADDCDDAMLLYVDADADGQGGDIMSACGVSSTGDCNDMNASINSNSIELCNGVDDNCNQEIDENVGTEFFADVDGDGFGNLNISIVACEQPNGYVTNSFDCDDSQLLYLYQDFDGFGGTVFDACGVSNSLDCMDFDDSVNPSAIEVCDNVDQNCDGQVDEGMLTSFYADTDGDGYGDSQASIELCESTVGYVADSTDCNDSDALINPGAVEIFDNAIDENCDGQVEVFVQEVEGMTWEMYPNPASENVFVTLSSIPSNEVVIYQSNGQLVKRFTTNQAQIIIDVQELENGIYFLRIDSESRMFVVSH
jgi:hypothetical protein